MGTARNEVHKDNSAEVAYFKEKSKQKIQNYLDELQQNSLVVSDVMDATELQSINKELASERKTYLDGRLTEIDRAPTKEDVAKCLEITLQAMYEFDRTQDITLENYGTYEKYSHTAWEDMNGAGQASSEVQHYTATRKVWLANRNSLSSLLRDDIAGLDNIDQVKNRICENLIKSRDEKGISNSLLNSTNISGSKTKTLLDQKKVNIDNCLAVLTKKNPPASIKEYIKELTHLREENEEALKKIRNDRPTHSLRGIVKQVKSTVGLSRLNTLLDAELKVLQDISKKMEPRDKPAPERRKTMT